MSFTNLIRFKDKDGRVLYGDVPEAHLNNIIGTNIPILAGDPFDDSLKPTNDSAVVDEVCCYNCPKGERLIDNLMLTQRHLKLTASATGF